MSNRIYDYNTVNGIVLEANKSGVKFSLNHNRIGYLPNTELKLCGIDPQIFCIGKPYAVFEVSRKKYDGMQQLCLHYYDYSYTGSSHLKLAPILKKVSKKQRHEILSKRLHDNGFGNKKSASPKEFHSCDDIKKLRGRERNMILLSIQSLSKETYLQLMNYYSVKKYKPGIETSIKLIEKGLLEINGDRLDIVASVVSAIIKIQTTETSRKDTASNLNCLDDIDSDSMEAQESEMDVSIDKKQQENDRENKQIEVIIENYPDSDFIDYAIEQIHQYYTLKSFETAIKCCVLGMTTCLKRLAEQEDEAYYYGYLDIFSEYLSMQGVGQNSEELTDRCLSNINLIELFESQYPDIMLFKPLIMTSLDKAAERCMEVGKYDVVVTVYEYQKAKLISYKSILGKIDYRLASINNKMIMPYMSIGKIEEAKLAGDSAYMILSDLFGNDPDRYAVEYLEICVNLGGIYMDLDELDMAQEIFIQGALARSRIFTDKMSLRLSIAEKALEDNISKLKKKIEGLE